MRLDQLLDQIAEFENCSFHRRFDSIPARKKAMKASMGNCNDDNLKSILRGSVDYISKRPELVRAAISKARAAVETLRENGPT